MTLRIKEIIKEKGTTVKELATKWVLVMLA